MSHLEQVSSEELDRLLGIVVDVENLFMCVHKVILQYENYILRTGADLYAPYRLLLISNKF